jgi:hypothetical protein
VTLLSAVLAGLVLASAEGATAADKPTGIAVPAPAAPAAPAPAAAASPVPAGAARGLRLGPYGNLPEPYAPSEGNTPRFETEVEVHGRAMDAATLTARLEWWFRDIDLSRGATPASVSAPSIEEMREYRPHPPDAVNLQPVVKWLTDKLKKKP